MNIKKRTFQALALGASAALALTACGAEQTATSGKLNVLASFYPLHFVTSQVGGQHVEVESLTPAGAEPHDLELSPAHTRKISTADLVVYQAGFQKAVDEAVEARKPEHIYDASVHAQGVPSHDHDHDSHGQSLSEDAVEDTHADHDEADHDHADHDHAHEEHAAETESSATSHNEDSHDGHDHGPNDPHFWLDPALLAATAQDIAAELSKIDPDNAADYQANATKLVENLDQLDHEYQETLSAQCTNRTIVVTHEAFGYMAGKYHFEQIGISGIDPEAEPSPATIKKVRALIEAANIDTIYFETLTSPKVAQTLANDLGIDTALLDPLEGLSDAGQDYFSVMRANLAALSQGMKCE